MSEVNRYKVDSIRLGNPTTARTHLMVHAELFDTALSQLAALREELAQRAGSIGALTGERDDLQQRLADAERRNETLAKAATEFMEYAESGWDHFPDVGVNLRAALNKPEEAKS